MKHLHLTKAEVAQLYEATRCLSSWQVMLLECSWIKDECRHDIGEFLRAIPSSWWQQFVVDDATEHTHKHEG